MLLRLNKGYLSMNLENYSFLKEKKKKDGLVLFLILKNYSYAIFLNFMLLLFHFFTCPFSSFNDKNLTRYYFNRIVNFNTPNKFQYELLEWNEKFRSIFFIRYISTWWKWIVKKELSNLKFVYHYILYFHYKKRVLFHKATSYST